MMSDHLLELLAADLAHDFNAELRQQIKDHRRTTPPRGRKLRKLPFVAQALFSVPGTAAQDVGVFLKALHDGVLHEAAARAMLQETP